MLKAADQCLDLAGSNIGSRQCNGTFTTERTHGRGEPASGCFHIAFEELKGLAKDSRESKEAVRFIWLEATLALPTVQGADLDVYDFGELAE